MYHNHISLEFSKMAHGSVLKLELKFTHLVVMSPKTLN